MSAQDERIADIMVDTDKVFDKPKVLEEQPKDSYASVVLAVTHIDGALFIIQKGTSLNDPGVTFWFKVPYIRFEDL